MKKLIKNLKKKSLSNSDILNGTYGKAKLYTYPQLSKFKTLDDAFDGCDSIVLLYLQTPNYGHWCCLNKINNNLVEFFDPYGYVIDSELKWVNKKTRKELKQECPNLSKLLIKSRYQLSYNEYEFQSEKKDINTCGRHCIIRICYRKIPLETYKKMFKSVIKMGNPDDIVTILTYDI
jgi:hypothetical protein